MVVPGIVAVTVDELMVGLRFEVGLIVPILLYTCPIVNSP